MVGPPVGLVPTFPSHPASASASGAIDSAATTVKIETRMPISVASRFKTA